MRRVDDSQYTTVVTGPDGKAVVTIDDEIRKELSGNYGNIYLIREKTPGSGYRPVHDTKFVVINVSYQPDESAMPTENLLCEESISKGKREPVNMRFTGSFFMSRSNFFVDGSRYGWITILPSCSSMLRESPSFTSPRRKASAISSSMVRWIRRRRGLAP